MKVSGPDTEAIPSDQSFVSRSNSIVKTSEEALHPTYAEGNRIIGTVGESVADELPD